MNVAAPDEVRDLPPYAVLVFRELDDPEPVVEALKAIGRDDCLVLVLNDLSLDDVLILNEAAMRDCGWVRSTTP